MSHTRRMVETNPSEAPTSNVDALLECIEACFHLLSAVGI